MTTYYPEWQKEIRKAQQERDEILRIKQEKDNAIELKENQAQWEEDKKKFQEAGFMFYPDEFPDNFTWEYEGYTFRIFDDYWHTYSRMISISKPIEVDAKYNHLSSFNHSVYRELKLNSFTLASVADAIDYIDTHFPAAIVRNQRLMESHDNGIDEDKPLSAEMAMLEAIRDFIREEIEQTMVGYL